MGFRARLAVLCVLTLAIPLALSGCAPWSEYIWSEVRSEVVASDPAIDDAFVVGAVGPAGTDVRVRVYVTSTDPATLTRVIDAALVAMIAGAPARPPSMGLDIAEAPMPAEPSILSNNLNLTDVTKAMGLYDQYSDGTISATMDYFEERYGRWEDLRE